MERVVITGMGIVSPIGNNIQTFWNNLINGESGISTINTFDVTNHKTKIAGIVQDFDADEVLGKNEARRLDRFSQFALAAAEQAWVDSKLVLDRINVERLGVYVGSGIGGMETLIENIDVLRQKGPRRVSPTLVPAIISNAAAAQISTYFVARFCLCNWKYSYR